MKDIQEIEDLPNLENRPTALTLEAIDNDRQRGIICPNCGAQMEGRKCKLFCTRPGCGYLVTCSEW
jgi:hypothetical protein